MLRSRGDLAVDSGYSTGTTRSARSRVRWRLQATRSDKLEIEEQERERKRCGGAPARMETTSASSRAWCASARRLSELDEMRKTRGSIRGVAPDQRARRGAGKARTTLDERRSVAAREELSASINDISQQAAHAAGIASRAVDQARETDGTCRDWRNRGRIGEVVGLINTIAAADQSARAERHDRGARAGEAGRGFAVVAPR